MVIQHVSCDGEKLGAHFKPTVGWFVCRKEEIANESRARTNDGM